MSFIDSDESDFSNSEEDYEPSDEVESEPISDEASPSGSSYERESDIDEINIFPITVHRKKRVVRFVEYEYY